jgi:hypothetical protein
MLREVFKKQIILLSKPDEPLDFATRLAIEKKYLQQDAIDELLSPQSSYEFKDKQKVFFLPGCTIPRFKANSYFKSIGVSTTKNSGSADVVLVGSETGKNILKVDLDYYAVNKEYLEDYVEEKCPSGSIAGVLARNILESDDCFPFITFKDYSVRSSWSEYKTLPTTTINTWITEEKRIKDIEDAILGKKIILSESFLSDMCNQTVMNEEMYHETRKMFESEDSNNYVLAIELMANCNYQKSGIYLLMLFKEFRGKISRIPEANHVNFSSMLSFYNLDISSWLNFDEMIEALLKKDCIKKEDYKKLITLATEEFGDEFNSDYFRYSSIEPTEVLINAIEEAEQKALKLSTQSPTQSETQESIISEEHE